MSKAAWIAAAVVVTVNGPAWTRTGIGNSSPVVCLSYIDEAWVPLSALIPAKGIVISSYAAIGVHVISGNCQSGGPEEIQIQFIASAPPWLKPKALAYAAPYASSGPRIQVIWARIARTNGRPGRLLGYVLAHEVGHVLEGINRHSSEGIMKASWTIRDYAEMALGKFAFASEDIKLIHIGIRASTREALAGN